MESKKLANMRAVLVRAWRERWPDTQWSIHTKRYVTDSAHTVQLADLLLQQATVGLSGNHLILSYFKHAINTQLVPFMVGIESISKFDDVGKVYCVKALMELTLTIVPNIGMKGNFEDSWKLVRASLQLLCWVLRILHRCLLKVQEDTQSAEYTTVVNKAGEVLQAFSECEAVNALLHIAHLDETEMYSEMMQEVVAIKDPLTNVQNTSVTAEHLAFINNLSIIRREASPILACQYHMLNPSINVLLHYEASLHPTNDIAPIVDQLLLIENLQGLERADLYCEMLRSCYMGMVNSVAAPEELKWTAFVLLKVPQIMLQLSRQEQPHSELEHGFNKFLHYVPLLNLADTKCGTDCLHLLVGELRKHKVASEAELDRILFRRKEESAKMLKPEQPVAQQPCAGLILRAEPTVTSILKTLDADYSKNQEGLFGVLGHMMSGKSFELILTAAAATGKLHGFATELIRFNEFARTCTGEGGRQANIRSLLFDTSFLMLCHIAQTYGIHVFQSGPPSEKTGSVEESFFVQWAHSSLPEEGLYKSLDLLQAPNDVKVDSLLQQFKPGNDLNTSLTKWNEVYQNAPYAVREILNAWEYGVLTPQDIQGYMSNVKSKMCSLAVVISSYLCSYIQSVEEKLRAKPIAMLEILVQCNTAPVDPADRTYIQERSNLMQLVISKMIQGVLPQSSSHKKHSPHLLPPTKPVTQMLLETWRDVFKRGCINNLDLMKFEHLLNIGGPQWFCDCLIKETLGKDRPEDLYKGVSFLYSLFSLDLQPLTLSLLHHTLPGLLGSHGRRLELLSGPRGLVLAKLCIMLIVLLQKMNAYRDSSQLKKGRKRTRTEFELEDCGENGDFEMRPSKMRKTDATTKTLTQSFTNEGFSLEDDESMMTASDPLNVSLGNLFKLFYSIVVSDELSQKSNFVQQFIQEIIKCEPTTTSFFAQFIPPNMISQLLRTMPCQFRFDVILSMCNLTNVQGRRIAAKVICQNERLKKEIETPSSIVSKPTAMGATTSASTTSTSATVAASPIASSGIATSVKLEPAIKLEPMDVLI